jgi:hypothetical protein
VIEKQCAKLLTSWADRWEERVEKVNEFGSLKDGWKAMLTEARGIAHIHTTIKVTIKRERNASFLIFYMI